MSNSNDPKQPTPDQPKPTDPNAKQPLDAGASDDSSFEFQLPDDVGSFSELPPIPSPNANESSTHAALPPKPDAMQRTGASFDFINLPESRGSFGDFGINPLPLPLPTPPENAQAPPTLVPTDDALVLPDLPGMPAPGDSALLFESQVPPVPGLEPVVSASLPDVMSLYPVPEPALALPEIPAAQNAVADIDLGSESGVPLSAAAVAPSVGFGGPVPVADEDLPVADAGVVADVEAEPVEVFEAVEVIDLEAEPVDAVEVIDLGADAIEVVPGDLAVGLDSLAPTAGPSSSFTMDSPTKPDATGSVPDVASLFPTASVLPELPTTPPDAVPDTPSSTGSTPSLPTVPVHQSSDSSFEFQLPDDVGSFSELPPIPSPNANESSTHAALPPKPDAMQRTGASFDFINVTGPPSSYADINFEGQVTDPVNPLVPTAEASPPDPAAVPDSKVEMENLEPVDPVVPASGWLEPVDPVVPASGWLESDVIVTPAAPSSDPFEALAADLVESSDIFSGSAPTPAELLGDSDILSAEPVSGALSGPPHTVDPVRPSEIAFTFNDPPGGSTVQDGDLSDLPVADEFANDESIHDQPDLDSDNPLFDSATLADTPDPVADAMDFGASPDFSPDASSILADLTESVHDSGDSSSVRVEAPGLNRTLTGGPSDDAFDLTVADEPIPAGLFNEPADGTWNESIDWQGQSGSDLISQEHTAADFDLNDVVEPVDADLEVAEDATDAVEFTDHPELETTVACDAIPPDEFHRRSPNLSSGDFELRTFPAAPVPTEPDNDAAVDWADAALADDEHAARGTPQDASLSAILRGELPDDSDEVTTKNPNARPRTPTPTEVTEQPEVSVDWLAASDKGSALAEPVPPKPAAKGKGKKHAPETKAKTKAKTDPNDNQTGTGTRTGTGTATAERETKPTRKRGGILAGLIVGALAVGGASAGAYFGGLIPNGEKGTGKVPPPPTPGDKVVIDGQTYVFVKEGAPVAPGPTGPQQMFESGDTAKALEHFKTNPPANLTDKTTAGHIRVFAKAQTMKDGANVPANDADLKTAREELQAVLANLPGLSEPGGVKRAVKAAVALGVSHEIAGDTKSARQVYEDAKEKYPAYASTFEALIDKLNALDPPTAAPGTSRRLDPADAERILFAVVLLLQDGPKGEEPEPGVFYWKAVNLAAGGKYKEAVDKIAEAKTAHVARAKAVVGRGLNPLSDPLEQIFARSCDELKAYWQLRGAVSGNPVLIADVMKKNDGVAKALDALIQAQKDVTAARATAKKLEGDVAKFDKDAKEFEKGKIEAETKLATATAALTVAEKDAKEQKDTLAMVVDALKPAGPLPEKWAPAELIAATKSVASRATGPDLKNLIPSTMVAAAGGLATGQLLELAERITKSEATAKDATAKLATETKRLTDKYDTDTAKLKTDSTAELKKLTDTYTADTKKLKDDHAVAAKELKDGSTDALKKLTDKYVLDAKKLTDDSTAATVKLKEEHATALKVEQANTEAEKKRTALREIEFQKQLANAVTPEQLLDLWLPTLTDLRRATDSAPALAAAEKGLAASITDSEGAAKARTVAGMAYLMKNDLVNAKENFQAARRGPAYKAATGKFWAKVADDGLEAVTDPAAPYRQPVVVPPVNLKAAAASLDAGIVAYKAGRYDAAVKALQDVTKYNPADPVAWYFLGATRWAQGDEEQAKKDFAQGSEREKVSRVPNRTLSEALAPIQGAIRDAIDRTRP